MTTDSYPKLFDLDDDYREMVRVSDPPTSRAAAKMTDKTLTREMVLRAFRDHPDGLTDFEASAITGLIATSCGKRRLDLQHDGLIERTELRRPSPTGSPAIVWKAIR